MEIRLAEPGDASSACQVLRRSIVELCFADHRNDPVVLRQWLANKTPEIVASWIARSDSTMLLAVDGGGVLGVAAVTDAGEITLNYVCPDARFRGVSRALVGALEERAMRRGNGRCHLTSTETAHAFYLKSGYCDDGPADHKFGASGGYPMSKMLVAPGI